MVQNLVHSVSGRRGDNCTHMHVRPHKSSKVQSTVSTKSHSHTSFPILLYLCHVIAVREHLRSAVRARSAVDPDLPAHFVHMFLLSLSLRSFSFLSPACPCSLVITFC